MSSVGSLVLEQKIGEGSYGAVYSCRYNKSRMAACKVAPALYGNPLLMESVIMSIFECPYLAHAEVITYGKDNVYIVSELATSDLKTWLKHTRVSQKEILSWLYSILTALHTLHEAQIIHADIKAGNMLLYPDNSVKLADFSLSFFAWTGEISSRHCCTVTHRPPEIWRKEPPTPAIDIWALGCTLYELCTGEYLFPVQDSLDKYLSKLLSWQEDDFTLPYHYTTCASIISACLRKSPEDRPTASILLQEYFCCTPEAYPPILLKVLPREDIFSLSETTQQQVANYLYKALYTIAPHTPLTEKLEKAILALTKRIVTGNTDLNEAEIVKEENYICLLLEHHIFLKKA